MNKKPIVDVMLDLETTGTKPGCGILAIGAVVIQHINSHSFYKKETEFYIRINPTSNHEIDLVDDPDTLKWWATQDKKAYEESWSGTTHITDALSKLNMFFSQLDAEIVVWGNGADFDLPILLRAYEKASLTHHIKYYNSRCFRTLKNLFSYVTPPDFLGTKHTALADAAHQAQHASAILNWIESCRRLQREIPKCLT